MSIKEAFFAACSEAKPAKGSYVSLYITVPRYGGPEEGGWWTHSTMVVAYQWYSTQEAAKAAKAKVEEEAKRLNDEARKEFGNKCLREMEWLDARGLDADYLPEVDGESEYSVVLEDHAGSQEDHGPTHYE